MEDPNSTLFPYILAVLSRKPHLCDSFNNLCKEVQAQLMKHKSYKCDNIERSMENALNVGQSLGIITLTENMVRVPFNFSKNNKNAAVAKARTRTRPAHIKDFKLTSQQPAKFRKIAKTINNKNGKRHAYDTSCIPKRLKRPVAKRLKSKHRSIIPNFSRNNRNTGGFIKRAAYKISTHKKRQII